MAPSGELLRLRGIFHTAGPVSVASIAVLALATTRLSPETASMLVSISMALFMAQRSYLDLREIFQISFDPNSTAAVRAAYAMAVYFVSVVSLYASNLFIGGKSWPLLVGFSVQLSVSAWLFTRFLTRGR